MKWEKHGDLFVLVDRQGWKRAILYPDGLWYAICTLGVPGQGIREVSYRNKRVAMRATVAEVRRDLGIA